MSGETPEDNAVLTIEGCANCAAEPQDWPEEHLRFRIFSVREGTLRWRFCPKCMQEFVQLDTAAAAAWREALWQKLTLRYGPIEGNG